MKKKIEITINRGQGQKEVIIRYLVRESTSGFHTSEHVGENAPRGEWFPCNSASIQSRVL